MMELASKSYKYITLRSINVGNWYVTKSRLGSRVVHLQRGMLISDYFLDGDLFFHLMMALASKDT